MAFPKGSPYIPPTNFRTKRSADSITISKDAGYKHSIKEIYAYGVAKAEYIDITVGSKVMLRLYQHDTVYPLVCSRESNFGAMGVMAYLRYVLGINDLLFAEEDEDLTIDCSNAARILNLNYWKEETLKNKSLFGGSQSPKFIVVAPITNAVAISADGNYVLATSKQPTGLPAIKNGYTVPADYNFTLHGIMMNSGKNGSSEATYLHIIDESSELITPESKQGIPCMDDDSLLIGSPTSSYCFKLPEPYVFKKGHTISINVDADYDDANAIAIDAIVVQLIGIMEYVG